MNTGLFLFTVFDIHTQRTLAPVFFFSFSLLPVTLVFLPLRLPVDAGWLEKRQWLDAACFPHPVVRQRADQGAGRRQHSTPPLIEEVLDR